MGTPKSNAGDVARLQEANRQSLIRSGVNQINSIYGGGTYGTGATDQWNPRNEGSLYTGSGKTIGSLTLDDPDFASWLKSHPNVNKAFNGNPTTTRSGIGNLLYHMGGVGTPGLQSATGGFNLFNPFGFGESQKTLNLEDVRRLYGKFLGGSGALFTGTATSPGFGPDFYNKRATDFVNYAMPQEEQQAGEASRNLTYKLANQGLTQSSAGQQLGSSLLQEINRQRQGIAAGGVQQAQDLQRQVETQRGNLISQLQVSADPGSATQQAISTSAGFSAPSQFQPLGNLFSNWANTYLGSQASTTNPSLFPYLYGLSGSRTGSTGFIPGNSLVRG